jgi:hypothetical protein
MVDVERRRSSDAAGENMGRIFGPSRADEKFGLVLKVRACAQRALESP